MDRLFSHMFCINRAKENGLEVPGSVIADHKYKAFPDLLLKRGPTISRAILENVPQLQVAVSVVLGPLVWKRPATSLLAPGQKNLCITRSVVSFCPSALPLELHMPSATLGPYICNTGSLHLVSITKSM